MKKIILSFSLMAFIGLTILSSCTRNSPKNDDFPDITVKKSNLNKFFRIEVLPQFHNTNKNNSIITIHLKNLTNRTIIIPLDSAISIYTHKNNEWVQVPNQMQYFDKNIYLYSTKDSPPGEVIGVALNIDNMSTKQPIKIIIIGYFEEDQQNLIGADIDITLLP